MNRISTIAIVSLLLILSAACKREEDITVAGKGGNATVRIYPRHGVNETLDSCWIYVKYNTLNIPYDGVYDDSLRTNIVDSVHMAVFAELRRGDYFFMAKGYSPDHGGGHVRGEYPIFVSDEHKSYDIILEMGH